MNEKKGKSLVEILEENDFVAFQDTVKSRIVEKLAWAYYHEMKDEIIKREDADTTKKDKQ